MVEAVEDVVTFAVPVEVLAWAENAKRAHNAAIDAEDQEHDPAERPRAIAESARELAGMYKQLQPYFCETEILGVALIRAEDYYRDQAEFYDQWAAERADRYGRGGSA